MGLDFCRNSIAFEILGEKDGKKYASIITTIFFAVLFFNITGVIPFLNIAGTSVIGMPIIFALWVYFLYLWEGVKKFGVGGYLKHSLFPPGVPKPIYILLTPVEFLQVFMLRPATLVIRLLANMMAGHLLLALCFAATSFLFFEASGAAQGVRRRDVRRRLRASSCSRSSWPPCRRTCSRSSRRSTCRCRSPKSTDRRLPAAG